MRFLFILIPYVIYKKSHEMANDIKRRVAIWVGPVDELTEQYQYLIWNLGCVRSSEKALVV